jgi:hypothetical protein
MNYDVCIAADGRREVRVQRGVQRIMAVFGYVEHASAEVFSTIGRFKAEQLEDAERRRILDSIKGTHESTG